MFHSLRIGLVLLGLLALLFYAIPSLVSQKISFSANIDTNTIRTFTGEIRCADVNADKIHFACKNTQTIYIDAEKISIDGQDYEFKENRVPYISISSQSDANNQNAVEIIMSSAYDCSDLKLLSGPGIMKINKDSKQSANTNFADSLEATHYAAAVSEGRNRLNIIKSGSVEISSTKDCSIEINNASVQFYGIQGIQDGTETKEPEITISFPSGIKRVHWIPDKQIEYELTNVFAKTIDIANIENITIEGNGDLTASYNLAPDVYPLNKQELEIESQAKTVSATIASSDNDRFNVELSGYADSITLARNGLKPSFPNWLKENVYVIPSMFLTIIGGAISIVNANAKEKKEKDKKSSDNKTENE